MIGQVGGTRPARSKNTGDIEMRRLAHSNYWAAGSGAFALSLALCSVSQSARAADASDSTAAGTLEEVVVTANKRAENLQEVPLAVSVINEDALQAAGITQFAELGKLAPSLTIRPAEHPVNSNISLRGVGTFAFGIGVESSVAVLVDEVPLAFPGARVHRPAGRGTHRGAARPAEHVVWQVRLRGSDQRHHARTD
jgi:hypothetical protein